MNFERIVCGVDESAESLEAARQAARLQAPGGSLLLVMVLDLAVAAEGGWAAGAIAPQLEGAARAALDRALGEAPGADSRLLEGDPVPSLLDVARQERATLLAVGTHGFRRTVGILLGSVATMILHEAPCSVLIARKPPDPERFPRSIIVGVDGSPEAAVAAGVAFELGERFGADARPIAACGAKKLDLESVRRAIGRVDADPRAPVHALVEASAEADLLVVGSRGLHGLRALGSVSERVAHQAACSVLVVRRPPSAS